VDIEKIQALISKVKVPLTDETFFLRLFHLVAKERKELNKQNEFAKICNEEYGDLSRRADLTKIQASVSIRNVLRTRKLVDFFINDKGNILTDGLNEKIEQFKHYLYSLGPKRHYDSVRQELILRVLNVLNNKEIVTLLKTISKPYLNKNSDAIIRNTLALPKSVVITDVHAKKAVFSAFMAYLRQSVGSCFGTAPSIIIHDEQPKQFLKDIIELLGTGRLKRTFGGVEYSVPFSASSGVGDLKRQLFFSDDVTIRQIEIWYSPGLINALDAASLFPEGLNLKAKIEKAKELCVEALTFLKKEKGYCFTNVEEILRQILLKEFNLKEEAILDFQMRERQTSREGLLLQVLDTGLQAKTSGQLIDKFLNQLEEAKNAFKAIADNALLKSWEFTIASFAENKAGFTTWNLYSSLGFRPNEEGGIGETMYKTLQIKLDESNRRVHDFQEEYEQAYSQIRYMETRLRTASTDKEVQWLKAEYQGKVHEFRFLEEMRDKIHNKAKKLANLFDLLIDIFMYFFPQYFQEVYDASMQDVAASQYDDSPAGFRLLFKYGRGNTAGWTHIYTPEEFIDSLANFFTSTEPEIRQSAELEGLEEEFSEIITAIVMKIRSPEFLETAFTRMARAHHTAAIKDPLHHLDKIEKKPWAYVSGGNMSTLVTTYYKREQKPSELSRWVENPSELLIFLIDAMKQLPQNIKEEYIKNSDKSMLMYSPTHAFLLKPGLHEFKKAWQNDLFSYTYVRDELILPRERFIRQMILDEEMMDAFLDSLIKDLPVHLEGFIKSSLKPIYKTLSPIEFRTHLVDQLNRDKSLRYAGNQLFTEEEIDSKLYAELPFFHAHELKSRVTAIFKLLPTQKEIDETFLEQILDALYNTLRDVKIISSQQLQEMCLSILSLADFKTTSEIDYQVLIAKACQQLGFALPAPIIIADSNWVNEMFAFVVNPGNGNLEFWRVGAIGTIGSPMSNWKQWLNGSRRDISWGIYNRPYEYSP